MFAKHVVKCWPIEVNAVTPLLDFRQFLYFLCNFQGYAVPEEHINMTTEEFKLNYSGEDGMIFN